MAPKNNLTKQSIEELVGSLSFKKGEQYFDSGRVSVIDISKDAISTHVQGRERYTVEVSLDTDS